MKSHFFIKVNEIAWLQVYAHTTNITYKLFVWDARCAVPQLKREISRIALRTFDGKKLAQDQKVWRYMHMNRFIELIENK